MKTETIEYKDGNVTLRGYLAYDEQKAGKRPGVLVMPEAFGLGKNAKSRAEQLAKLGYVALAGDPYGNGEELSDLQEAIKRATAIFTEPGTARRRMRVGLEKLASLPQTDPTRLAAIGYCMGGALSLEAARDGAPLKGIVSFHGALQTGMPRAAGQGEGENSRHHRSRRSVRPGRASQRVRRRDDEGGRRLADHFLWRRQAQLHEPGRRQRRQSRHRVQQESGRAIVEGHADLLRRDLRVTRALIVSMR